MLFSVLCSRPGLFAVHVAHGAAIVAEHGQRFDHLAHFMALALVELQIEVAIGKLAHAPGNLLDGARQSPADDHRQYDTDNQRPDTGDQNDVERRRRHRRTRRPKRILARLHRGQHGAKRFLHLRSEHVELSAHHSIAGGGRFSQAPGLRHISIEPFHHAIGRRLLGIGNHRIVQLLQILFGKGRIFGRHLQPRRIGGQKELLDLKLGEDR